MCGPSGLHVALLPAGFLPRGTRLLDRRRLVVERREDQAQYRRPMARILRCLLPLRPGMLVRFALVLQPAAEEQNLVVVLNSAEPGADSFGDPALTDED